MSDYRSEIEAVLDNEAIPAPGRNLPEPSPIANAVSSIDGVIAGENEFEQLQNDGDPPLGNTEPKDGINPFIPRNPTVGPNTSSRKTNAAAFLFKRLRVIHGHA